MKCPECRSKRLIKFGWKYAKNPATGRRHLVQQYLCKNCGRITIHPKKETPRETKIEIIEATNDK